MKINMWFKLKKYPQEKRDLFKEFAQKNKEELIVVLHNLNSALKKEEEKLKRTQYALEEISLALKSKLFSHYFTDNNIDLVLSLLEKLSQDIDQAYKAMQFPRSIDDTQDITNARVKLDELLEETKSLITKLNSHVFKNLDTNNMQQNP